MADERNRETLDAERIALRVALQFPEPLPSREARDAARSVGRDTPRRARGHGPDAAAAATQSAERVRQESGGQQMDGQGVLFLLEIIASATERMAATLDTLAERADRLDERLDALDVAAGRTRERHARPDR